MRAVMFLSSMSARRRAGGLSPTGLLMRREDSWDGPARAASFMRQLHTRVGAPDRSLGLASSPRGPRAGLRRGGYPRARALAGVITESGCQKERQRSLQQRCPALRPALDSIPNGHQAGQQLRAAQPQTLPKPAARPKEARGSPRTRHTTEAHEPSNARPGWPTCSRTT